jgi:hypothetical protein
MHETPPYRVHGFKWKGFDAVLEAWGKGNSYSPCVGVIETRRLICHTSACPQPTRCPVHLLGAVQRHSVYRITRHITPDTRVPKLAGRRRQAKNLILHISARMLASKCAANTRCCCCCFVVASVWITQKGAPDVCSEHVLHIDNPAAYFVTSAIAAARRSTLPELTPAMLMRPFRVCRRQS